MFLAEKKMFVKKVVAVHRGVSYQVFTWNVETASRRNNEDPVPSMTTHKHLCALSILT